MIAIAIIAATIIVAELFVIRWYRRELVKADRSHDEAIVIFAIANYAIEQETGAVGAYDTLSLDLQCEQLRQAQNWWRVFSHRLASRKEQDA